MVRCTDRIQCVFITLSVRSRLLRNSLSPWKSEYYTVEEMREYFGDHNSTFSRITHPPTKCSERVWLIGYSGSAPSTPLSRHLELCKQNSEWAIKKFTLSYTNCPLHGSTKNQTHKVLWLPWIPRLPWHWPMRSLVPSSKG